MMDATIIYILMAGCVLAGALMVYVVDHFFLFKSYYRPSGELIFKKINEDEAQVNLKIYETCLDEVYSESEKVVLKVLRE